MPCDITYLWDPNMTQMNLSTNRNELTDIEKGLVVAKGDAESGRDAGRVWD